MPSNTKHVFLRLSSITSWLELKITSITLPTAKGTDKLIPLDKNKSVTPAAIRKVCEWLCFHSKNSYLRRTCQLVFFWLGNTKKSSEFLNLVFRYFRFCLVCQLCSVMEKTNSQAADPVNVMSQRQDEFQTYIDAGVYMLGKWWANEACYKGHFIKKFVGFSTLHAACNLFWSHKGGF